MENVYLCQNFWKILSFVVLSLNWIKTNLSLEKRKKSEFKQCVLDKLDNLYSEDPTEYWSLVNSLRNENNDKREYNIGGKGWLDYFSNLGSIPIYMKEKVHKIEKKL